MLAWDKQNRQQGLKPFQPIYVTDDAAATLAIQSGRADAYFGPNVLGAYKAALNGRTRLAGTVEGGWPWRHTSPSPPVKATAWCRR